MLQELFLTTKLTTQEKKVIDYIMENPQSIFDLNAKELSQKTNVSSPTIIRLTKKLGFKGYSDFQLSYVQEYTLNHQVTYTPLTANSNIHDVIETLPEMYFQIINGTKNMIKKEPYVRTMNYMLQAKQIDFYANDNNYAQVQSACLKLNSLGIRAQAFNTINQSYVDSSLPQDVLAFVVSHTGRNQTMVDAAYMLRKKRIRVIAITGILDPTLELICNESLYLYTQLYDSPKELLTYGFSLTYILDILVMGLSIKKRR